MRPSRPSRRHLASLAALALLAAAALSPRLAAAQAASDAVPTLQANGEGEVMVVPDIAIVTIGVVSRAPTAGDALAANSTDLQRVVDTVKAAGVDEKDIGTTGFSVTPVYQTVPRPPVDIPAPIIGYTVENDVRVTIRALASSGAILDHVVQAGANRINGISFDIADRKSAENDAIKAAIADAKARAQLMADAAGVTLGRVLSVSASSNGVGPFPAFARGALAAAPPPPVLAGQQTVSANASISWEISGK
jgi:uncharacterized protein